MVDVAVEDAVAEDAVVADAVADAVDAVADEEA